MPDGCCVCLCYLPLQRKVQNKISSGAGHPGCPGKRARKRLCVCVTQFSVAILCGRLSYIPICILM